MTRWLRLSRVWLSSNLLQGAIEPGNVTIFQPIQGLWRNGPEVVIGLKTGPTKNILEAGAVGKLPSARYDISPRGPDILFSPIMRQIIDLS
jgi:hypothetical protein